MDARMRRDAGDGFTMIELTNLILIADILIPIAVPTYPGDEDATRSSDATSAPGSRRL